MVHLLRFRLRNDLGAELKGKTTMNFSRHHGDLSNPDMKVLLPECERDFLIELFVYQLGFRMGISKEDYARNLLFSSLFYQEKFGGTDRIWSKILEESDPFKQIELAQVLLTAVTGVGAGVVD